ncbi:est [Symbiodinium necroappetens]|uniref:Est protein n=1 Tax=Symbiodinium necroappetens TaxID=1628268 RepID=A0A812X6M3_9DINO|nr:est [Symbiodinium necroappetens]
MTEVPQNDVAQSWSTDRNSRYDGRAGYREGFTLRMSPGERGCAMSHVRAWRRTAAGNRPVLILEDDAVPAKQFCKRLKRVVLAAAEQSADALYLGHIQGAPWRQRLAPGLYEAEYLWTPKVQSWEDSGLRPVAEGCTKASVCAASGSAGGQLHGLADVPEAVLRFGCLSADGEAGARMGPRI